jgi:hypothetical protein
LSGRAWLPALALASVAFGAGLGAGCRGDTYYLGTDCLGSGTEKDLQGAIDTRATVVLCQGALITLSNTISLPQGLTLLTDGLPTDASEMATILIGPDFPGQLGPAVGSAGSDIRILAVRFDGNRRVLGPRDQQIPLELGRGGHYTVQGCSFADSPGWTHLHLLEGCDASTIVNNVVESAPRPHDNTGHWSDGLSISCAHTLVAGNRINDATAEGIVYYGGPGSTIRDNVITQTVTSAFSGINIGDAIVPDNSGVVIQNNRIIAKGPSYLTTGLAAGLHIDGKLVTIRGVSVLGNTIEGMARYGLAVDGCLGCTVTGNDVTGWHPLPPIVGCPPPASYVAAVTVVHASGRLQPGFLDGKIDNCKGPAEVLGALYRMYAGDFPTPPYLAFEVQVFSQRMEQRLDAESLLRAEWDTFTTRAQQICPGGSPADLQSVWRRLTEAQFAGNLSPAAADAQVRMDLTAAPPGTPCSPPAP